MVLTIIAAFIGSIAFAGVSLGTLFGSIPAVIVGGSLASAKIFALAELATKQEQASCSLKKELPLLKDNTFFTKGYESNKKHTTTSDDSERQPEKKPKPDEP